MKTLSLLIKPASSLCNLRCRYCFYEDEAANRQHRSMGIMSSEVTQALLQKARDYLGEEGLLSVTFQGGEPTLAGAEYFREFTRLARQLLPPGVQIQYGIQTNGFALSQELIEVLKQNRFLVGISLDGFRALHNANRTDPQGEGTWSRILANLRKLQAAGVEVNALCVITGEAAAQAQKIYRTLKQLGFRYQQYILCLDPLEAERGSMGYSISPEQYGRFLTEAFDLWYGDWKRQDYVSIRLFEDFVFNALGDPCSSCVTSGRCGQSLVIEADGSAYPCDFYALDQWKLGNICSQSISDLLCSEAARQFAQRRLTPPPECGSCPHRSLCRTGCVRDWEARDGVWHNFYCQSFRMLLSHGQERIRQIAQAESRFALEKGQWK